MVLVNKYDENLICPADDVDYLDEDEWTLTDKKPTDFSAEELGFILDEELSNANYHSFDHVGSELAGILVEHVGFETATKIMAEILGQGVFAV